VVTENARFGAGARDTAEAAGGVAPEAPGPVNEVIPAS
jgi:hypothetical protein